MEKATVNDKEHLADLLNCDENIVSLNSDNHNSNKNRFYHKPKPGNLFRSRTCSYFYNKGYCKFGDNCKYKHFIKENNDTRIVKGQNTLVNKTVHKIRTENNGALHDKLQSSKQKMSGENFRKEDNCGSFDNCSDEIPRLDPPSNIPLSQGIPPKIFTSSNRQPRKWKKPVCYYYKRGSCYKGDTCNYHHISNILNKTAAKVPDALQENDNHLLLLNNDKIKIVKEENSTVKVPAVSSKSLNIHEISSLTFDTLLELRTTEIKQLKKRFPRLEVVKENQIFSFMFQPSDPDWAFDVKSVKLEVNFPEKYPTEKCKIAVIQSANNIPGLLIKFLNKAISEWVDKKFEENSTVNKTELIFRIFLKWFDKNLEDLFIAGLKKVKQDLKAKEDGIEFVPVEDLFPSPKNDSSEDSLDKNSIVINTSQLQEPSPVSQQAISEPMGSKSNKLSYNGESNGMKVILFGLELTESAATLICTKISVTLQCCRCKTQFNMKSVPKKNNCYVCSKCSKNVGFTFDPSTVHQFSSVLGYLYLNDCAAVDINLVECHFLVDCLGCSKQVPVDGIHYGQKHKMWCLFCNEKMLIYIGSMKFQAAKLASLPDAKYLPSKKVEKKAKDPVVKEGEPLPNFGACKHYKKSFRWLRFPCCGRLYPCDVCHDEKETDHEMKYASRMICGFCAKEQPYSREKPCLLCSQNLTKKSGSHWEGGKGCRNKIQMSREDKQKYSGVSKTISRKAQSSTQKKKH